MAAAASGYQLAELFAIRPTGVPFEVLESLATPGIAAAARALLPLEDALAHAARAAAAGVAARTELSAGQRERLLRKLQQRADVPPRAGDPDALVAYRAARAALVAAEATCAELLAAERAASCARLYELAARHLPDLAVVQRTSGTLAELLAARTRKGDRTLATWLQRVCSKNDTISRFGPSAWGVVDPAEPGLRLAPRPGLTRRVWVERWVVRAVIAAINADPDVRPELAPRALEAADGAGELPAADRALLARCDGRTPAHALGDGEVLARLAELAARGLARWAVEPLFIDNTPLDTLAADVAAWRPGSARARWGAIVDRLGAAAAAFAREPEAAARERVLAQVTELLAELGAAPRPRTGTLYEASNPLLENCSRAGDFALGPGPIAELLADATPWLDLFRDAAALAGDRVYDALRAYHAEAPRRDGRVVLRDLLAYGEARGAEIGGLAQARVAESAFAEIRAALARALAGRADAPAWELTEAECRSLRGAAPPRPDLPYPSADLQLAAASPAAIARGEYQWVVAELHHGFAIMGQSLSWSCPDPALLAARLSDAHLYAPTAFYDSVGSLHAAVHVSNEATVSGLAGVSVVTDHRTRPAWRAYSPGAVEVVLDEARRDLRLACLRTGADLGTLAPLARYFFGLHPFFPVQLPHHTPRLVRGRTVLQRESWVVRAAELGGPYPEGSPRLIAAAERLRAARGLPRWVFLRLRGDLISGAALLGRRKDAKPLCLDLESCVFVEILAQRLAKYGIVELVEMLPAPDQLLWRDEDGRRCCELRTLLVPGAGRPAAAPR